MILSRMIEDSPRQGLLLTRGSFLAVFERPITLTLYILTAANAIRARYRSISICRSDFAARD